jgi:hypothetical protein
LCEQAGAVPLRVLPGQVPDFQPVDPDCHCVRVIGVVIFGDQYGIDVFAHPLFAWAGSGQLSQIGLVERLADHFQVLITVQQRNLRAVAHPTRALIGLLDSLVSPVVLTVTWLTPENSHVACLAPQQCKPRMPP